MRKGTFSLDGEKLRSHRIERGWTQEDLAKKAGCVLRTIVNAESGEPVVVPTAAIIAEALDCPVSDLLPDSFPVSSDSQSAAVSPQRRDIMPALPQLLIGRDNDLDELFGRMSRAANGSVSTTLVMTAVRGWPGVGKTTVARAFAHSPKVAAGFPDGVLWTSLGPTPEILSELINWARALGDADVDRTWSVTDASHRLTGLLRGCRKLLVVDDVWEPNHAIPFIIGGPSCAILVTTRSRSVADSLAPTPGDIFRLDVLSEDQSLELLRRLVGDAVDQNLNDFRELVRELEGLPLALRVAGGLLRAEQQRGWSVVNLLRELRSDKTQLLLAKAPIDMASAVGEVSATVSALLRKSTDRLEPIVRKRFAYLGPFVPFPAIIEVDDIIVVWGASDDDGKRTIDTLADVGLIESLGDRRYQIHQVLVAHAKSLLKGK